VQGKCHERATIPSRDNRAQLREITGSRAIQ